MVNFEPTHPENWDSEPLHGMCWRRTCWCNRHSHPYGTWQERPGTNERFDSRKSCFPWFSSWFCESSKIIWWNLTDPYCHGSKTIRDYCSTWWKPLLIMTSLGCCFFQFWGLLSLMGMFLEREKPIMLETYSLEESYVVLKEEISNNHLIKPCKQWDIYHINRFAGFLNHQPYRFTNQNIPNYGSADRHAAPSARTARTFALFLPMHLT